MLSLIIEEIYLIFAKVLFSHEKNDYSTIILPPVMDIIIKKIKIIRYGYEVSI